MGVPIVDYLAVTGASLPASLRILSLVLRIEDGSGVPLPVRSAFSALSFTMGADTAVMDVSGITASSVTLVLPAMDGFLLPPGVSRQGRLAADVASDATASSVRVVLPDALSVRVQEDVPPFTVALVSDATDSTGFPMASGLFDLAGAYTFSEDFRGLVFITIQEDDPAATALLFLGFAGQYLFAQRHSFALAVDFQANDASREVQTQGQLDVEFSYTFTF